MAIKGGHHHKELFSLCPVKQQIFFSPYYMYSPVISTVGRYERQIPCTQCLQVFLMPYNFKVLLYLDEHFSIAWHVSSEYQVLRDTSPFRIIKQQNSLHPLMGLPGERNSHQQRLKQSVAWEAWLGTLHCLMARKSSVGSTGPNRWGKSSGTILEAPGEKKATT